MKFHLELTAGRFIRKSIRQNLENTKKKLEFNFTECRVLVTESKSIWESTFHIEGKDIPDSVVNDVKRWINQLKECEN